VQYQSVTEHWGQMAIAGPKSRDLLNAVVDDTDLSDEAFPFMTAGEISILGGLPARLFRISFSGERAYELAVPADYGDAVWNALMDAGAPHDIVAYGTEALSIMRIEKGHPAGPELDGRTTAGDLGLGRMMSGLKDFLGKSMAGRPSLIDPERPQLVGLKPVEPGSGEPLARDRLRAGSHLLARGAKEIAANDLGWVASAAFSPMLDSWIGLGFLKRGMAREGEQFIALDFMHDARIAVEVTSPVFFDPEGKRLHG